jgi:hypothetical protein
MRLLVLAACVLAIAIAGCGGESKQESYRKDFQSLNRSLVQEGRSIGRTFRTTRGKSDKQIGSEFGSHADRLQGIEKDLHGLKPPGKLAREQSTLERAVGQVRRALRGIETAAAKNDLRAARRSLIRLVTASVALTRARQRLSREVAKSG